MIVINLQLQRGLKIHWNYCASHKNVLFGHMRSKETFWKKPSSGWKKRFWPVFLVLPVMTMKKQLFEKELCRPSFLVLCSVKNLSEHFITTHIISWRFFRIIKLQIVRTYEAEGGFSKKKCYLPDHFDLFFLVILSIATSGSNSVGQK